MPLISSLALTIFHKELIEEETPFLTLTRWPLATTHKVMSSQGLVDHVGSHSSEDTERH